MDYELAKKVNLREVFRIKSKQASAQDEALTDNLGLLSEKLERPYTVASPVLRPIQILTRSDSVIFVSA